MSISRRDFFSIAFVGAIFNACKKEAQTVNEETPEYPSDDILSARFNKKLTIGEHERLVFVGDSITWGHRDAAILEPNKGLGDGYVQEIARLLASKSMLKECAVYNRGVSGNTTKDLLTRLDKDVISLKPTIAVVLIGVNDLRHNFKPEEFYYNYNNILKNLQEKVPGVKLVVCEPFILSNMEGYSGYLPVFTEYRRQIRKLAKEVGAIFVPYYDAFFHALQTAEAKTLLYDGFHPTPAGIKIISNKWIEYCSFHK
ncbi:lysophospholipase L1-like esterase [Filimonas zeae]|uniref:Lipase n=1 Tax=Filimonas zeae TaxID=1737353 RepID=A0A917MYL6_9BACT|nr:SGNH/GDSL hydrolase family protein [Filimonas zeae]MDR6341832.1 lysophospholipase L1-like esterase [Filimonas zeae]GGH80160.1 lipase [Filimonas zeae]